MMSYSAITKSSIFLALVAILSAPSTVMGLVVGEDDVFNTTECLSIADIICTEGLNLNALCEAITITELDDDLNEDAWTIFAPTDLAFEALGRDNLDALVMANDTVALTDLLLFHIVPGVALTSDLLPCEAGNNLLDMANGETSRTLCEAKVNPVEQRGQFNDKADAPKFVDMDIMACNGVVHTLDKVLLYQELPYDIPEASDAPLETAATPAPSVNVTDPGTTDPTLIPPVNETIAPTEEETSAPTLIPPVNFTIAPTEEEPSCLSIVDLACSNPDFSTACTLLIEYGLADALRTGTWTIFAPTNEAFDNAPRFEDDIDYILLGHAVSGAAIPAEDLLCSELTEMANGKNTRTVCKDEGVFQKGRGNSDDERPKIIDSDITACNGIVHVVDQVILF